MLRPKEVLDAHAAHGRGEMSTEKLREIEDEAILTALEAQRQAGIEVFSDGEYRRASWAGEFAASMDGYVDAEPPIPFTWRMPDGKERAPENVMQDIRTMVGQGNIVIGQRLRQKRRLSAHEVGFLKEHAPGPFKITLPAPSYVVARGYKPGVTDNAYPSRKALLDEVVKIYQAEVQALVNEGVPYVQLDNPHYPDYIEETRLDQWRAIGINPDEAILDDIAADSAAFAGVDPQSVTRALHICRGNGRSAWHTSGGYERIAERVFGGLDVDVFLLEYDSDRAGGFEPLRYMPRGKTAVLGLVTTKVGDLENEELLAQRIDEASKHMPLEDLAVSPQCGFASMSQGNLLSWDDQRRKLELVANTARHVWG
jgi:5-methyltetrahydropteroyltriglutamate--homocysteine methyltransferase